MGLSPAECSYLDSGNFLWNAASTQWVVPRLLRKYNNKGAFERWSWVAIVCHILVSQSWRGHGGNKLRMVLQYAVPAMLVCHPWGEVCNNSLRAMIIKQGIEVTDAGRGELSSSYDVFIKLAQVLSPMVWSFLFNAFGAEQKTPFLSHLYIKTRSFYQDRLRTNIGKLEKEAFCAGNAKPASVLGRIGPGGHMLVMALLRLIALRLVSGIDPKDLKLGDN
jgi:hypothetical protein